MKSIELLIIKGFFAFIFGFGVTYKILEARVNPPSIPEVSLPDSGWEDIPPSSNVEDRRGWKN